MAVPKISTAQPPPTPTHTITLTSTIAAPASTVFRTITRIDRYSDWLPPSTVFQGTTQISHNPIRPGTTYIESGPSGTRYGEVLELVDDEEGDDDKGVEGSRSGGESERKVVFHQPMRLRPEWMGLVIDVLVGMTVTGRGEGGCRVDREIRLAVPLLLRPVGAWMVGQFRVESERAMGALKVFLEG